MTSATGFAGGGVFVSVNGSSVAAPRHRERKIQTKRKLNTGGRSQRPAPVHRHARGQSSRPLACGHLVRTQEDTGEREKKNTHRVLHKIKIYRVLGITEKKKNAIDHFVKVWKRRKKIISVLKKKKSPSQIVVNGCFVSHFFF